MASSFVAVELLRPRLINQDSDLLERKPSLSQWPCILCTYLNNNNWVKCELCLTPRTIIRLPIPKSLTKSRKRPTKLTLKRKQSKSRKAITETRIPLLSPSSSSIGHHLECSISNEIKEELPIATAPLHPPPANKFRAKTVYKQRDTTKIKRKFPKTPMYKLPATQYDKRRTFAPSVFGASNFSFADCVFGELKSAITYRKTTVVALEKYEESVQKHESTLLEILKYCVIGDDVINTITYARCDVLCHFLPLIAFTLCQSDISEFKLKLLHQLSTRIVGQSDLRQAVTFFMNSYDVDNVASVFNGICDEDRIHSITFWRNILSMKNIKANDKIDIPQNTVLRDPVKQCASPLKHVIIRKVIHSNSKPLLIDCYAKGYLSSTMILKYGDDLRKDKSCMLVFKWMNYMLYKYGIKILTYNVIPMSKLFGCIQLIPDCIPLRDILSLKTLIAASADKLLNNLIASAAGSYVASYIMGVRDRHFDNILIRSTDCTLFHIDMNYVMGDTIMGLDANKFGITREFYDVLGKDHYKRFVQLACKAFIELRHHHQELINFACLAFSYVYDYACIKRHITKQLRINESDKKAKHWLKNQLQNAPFNKQTILKNAIHKLATR